MVEIKIKFLLFILFFFEKSAAVIYRLNESFYDTLPPMFGLDAYAPCLRQPGGTYCLAKLDLTAEPTNELMRILQEYSEHTVKHYNHTYIERGVCLLQTCHKFINGRDLNDESVQDDVLEACLNDTMYREYGLNAKLNTKYYCDKKVVENEYDTSDWIVAGIILSIILINLIGTVYHAVLYHFDKAKELTNEKSLLLAFSVYRNWESLVAPSSSDPKLARLKGFHGIKSLAMFMVILPHVLWLVMSYVDNPHDFELNYELPFYQLIFNGLVIVQTFFVISGFLLVYNLEVYAEKQPIKWMLFFKVMLLRWCRLTPAAGLMIAFTATWLRYLGSGPVWNYFITTTVVKDCRSYWWSHIFYFNNYIPDDMYCAIQTWYIAVDTQLFAVGLLTYLATRHSGGRVRGAALLALLVAGMAAPALHVWLQDLDGMVLVTPQFQRTFDGDSTFRYIHKPGHNNLPSYVIGMATGYLVFHWRKTSSSIANNKLLARLIWAVIPAIMALFFSGNFFYADGERASLAVRILYGATHRVALGLIISFSIVGLVMKFDVVLRRMFEWRGWVVPSRLSYCVYLVHANVIHSVVATRTTLGHVSTYNIIFYHFGVVMTSFLLAWPLYLMVESPVNKFVKIIFNVEYYRKKPGHQQDVP